MSKSTEKSKDGHSVGNQAQSLLKELNEKNLGDGIDMRICDEFMRIMKKPNIYIWCNKKQIYKYLDYFVEKAGCTFEILVWCKTNPIPLFGRQYMNDKEYCLYFKKGIIQNTTYESGKTFWVSGVNQKDKRLYGHPTVKPEWIIEHLVSNSSSPGDTVLDCFLGSGTTAVVSKRLNRNFLGIELDPDYYQTAVNRVNEVPS